jgi:hypothetical protein
MIILILACVLILSKFLLKSSENYQILLRLLLNYEKFLGENSVCNICLQKFQLKYNFLWLLLKWRCRQSMNFNDNTSFQSHMPRIMAKNERTYKLFCKQMLRTLFSPRNFSQLNTTVRFLRDFFFQCRVSMHKIHNIITEKLWFQMSSDSYFSWNFTYWKFPESIHFLIEWKSFENAEYFILKMN